MDAPTVQLVMQQFSDVQAQHPGLELVVASSGSLLLCGNVGFAIEYDGSTVTDNYQVELTLPGDYPEAPPMAKETGGAIPRDFHQFSVSGELCLGAPIEVRRRFAQHKTLLGFINQQLIPFLFSYSYLRDFGKLPFGELAHGSTGLLQYYMTFFGTTGLSTLKLLKRLADGFAPPMEACPCGSGRTLERCHGPRLDELRPYSTAKSFQRELRSIVREATAAGIPLSERDVLPRKTWRSLQKKRARRKRRS